MIIVQDKQIVHLKDETNAIITLSTAHKGFVFVELCDNPSNIQKLVHIDKQGNRLKQFHYADSIDTFGMFNQKQVIVMNVSKNLIDIIDIQTYQIRSYPHKYKFPDTAYMQLHLFFNTKIFCIQQKGSTADHRLILTYYLYEASNITEITRFQSTAQFNCQNYTAKLNNDSKIGWWKNYQQGFMQFYVFQVNKNEGKPLLIKVNLDNINLTSYQSNQNAYNRNLTISKMWEMTENIFIFVCDNVQDQNQNILIFDAKKNILKHSKFKFNNDWNKYIIDFFYCGQISVFHTYKFKEGVSQESPVFYIHNQRQEMFQTDTYWKCSNQTQFYVPGFQSSMIIETYRQNLDSYKLQINTVRLVSMKQSYLYFLLHLNEDFDDDILKDAIQFLE